MCHPDETELLDDLQIPFGIKIGSGVSVGRYIVHSMIPNYIGNTIVAAFVLSGSYAFVYGSLGDTTWKACLRLTGRHARAPNATHDSAHLDGDGNHQHVRNGEGRGLDGSAPTGV